MQPKVSIVIPCYNKEMYISKMFDSILAQDWGRVELILVNDGSTDGTRGIIAEYERIFSARGFEVVIVDQKNQGVSTAVYEGLKKISGDFVCQVDADDELHPEYLSTMAGWLAEHEEYQWAACDAVRISNKTIEYYPTFPNGKSRMIEMYIMRRMYTAVWVYMVRAKYLTRCGIIEKYTTCRKGNQEPQFFLPLAEGMGKIKHFQLPLYKWMYEEPETHLSYLRDFESSITFINDCFDLINKTISNLTCGKKDKMRFSKMSEFSRLMQLIEFVSYEMYSSIVLEGFSRQLVKMVNDCLPADQEVTIEHSVTISLLFCTAITDNVFDVQAKCYHLPKGRVIAWGAMGRQAKVVLPVLEGTPLEPTELWDIAGDGTVVKKPDVDSLTENDLVLVVPKIKVGTGIQAVLEGANCSVMPPDDLMTYAAAAVFPDFYDGSIRLLR